MLRWICMILALLAWPGMAFAANTFLSLGYDEMAGDESGPLVQQFNWLRENGYHPISVDDLIVARNGGLDLPDKAVLLSFDGGHANFYTQIFPLLKAFHFPAMLALTGSTMEDGTSVTWDQVREMAKSGLIEIASHSYGLDRGIPANPQGTLEPAMVTRLYDAAKGGYEDDQTYRDRLQLDLESNSAIIARETGRRPRVMVWPHGAYNGMALDLARQAGMEITATLDSGMADTTKLNAIPRRIMTSGSNFEDMAVPPLRVVQVDMDYVYDADAKKQDANVEALLARIKALGANTVVLQAGTAAHDAVYFPNRALPMRADLFNRVSWQLMHQMNVKVFARLPMLDPAVYEDLARYAPLDGLLFQDGTVEQAHAIAKRVAQWRSPVVTVRTFDPHGVLNVDEMFGQSLGEYDYITIAVKEDGLAALVKQVSRHADGLRRTVFELPSVDRSRSGSHIPSEDLRKQISLLVQSGASNFGYSPDHFLTDNPAAAVIAPAFSGK